MRYLSFLILMFLVVGCVEPDPMRAAIANERTIQATNSQAAQAAQIDRAQQADADARNAQELLQALQAQQAIVAAQAAQAQAQSQSVIVQSNNEALVMVADRFVEATQPDYKPLYAGMAALVVIVVVWLVVNGRKAAVVAPQAPQRTPAAPEPSERADKPVVVYMTEHAFAYRLPDETIILHRYRDGKERVYLPADPFYQRLLTGSKQ